MLTDRLLRADRYAVLAPAFARAFGYVRALQPSVVTEGRHDIDSDRMFALVQRYTTKPVSEGRWECHRKYVDLQLVLSGIERIGYVDLSRAAAAPYDAQKDVSFFEAHGGDFVTVPAGHFMVLWPDDGHMPGIIAGSPAEVVKVVVKIAVAVC